VRKLERFDVHAQPARPVQDDRIPLQVDEGGPGCWTRTRFERVARHVGRLAQSPVALVNDALTDPEVEATEQTDFERGRHLDVVFARVATPEHEIVAIAATR
jgi:hypothetical protein